LVKIIVKFNFLKTYREVQRKRQRQHISIPVVQLPPNFSDPFLRGGRREPANKNGKKRVNSHGVMPFSYSFFMIGT
jgi:hypothetical protein